MEQFTICIQANNKVSFKKLPNGDAALEYSLANSYYLDKPFMARVLKIHGSKRHLFVKVPFVEPQDVGGRQQTIVGSSLNEANAWVRVNTSFIPQMGTLIISNISGSPIDRLENITIWIHFVAEDSLGKYSINSKYCISSLLSS